MGHGAWTNRDFEAYAARNGRSVSKDGSVKGNYTAQEMYKSRALSAVLNPRGVIRECCDTPEHPRTIPVILALDVTGSMGGTAVEVAKQLNKLMTDLYSKIQDVEFLIMGIGDVMYDCVPIQASQFESDIRIAEQLDQIYFEAGGGGNSYESYTGAWYFGARHTKLDCWKRGKKGIIITMGDERINPYIPLQGRRVNFGTYMGDTLQADVESRDILEEVRDKYELYHLVVDHGAYIHRNADAMKKSFAEYIGDDHVRTVTIETITDALVDIITAHAEEQKNAGGGDAVVTWGTEEPPNEKQAAGNVEDKFPEEAHVVESTGKHTGLFEKLFSVATW